MIPDNGDSWVKRYFILRRPCLHMYTSPNDKEDVAVFSLVNVTIQFGSELGNAFQSQQRSHVFAILSKYSTILLQASSQSEMDEWISVLDPLQFSLLQARNL